MQFSNICELKTYNTRKKTLISKFKECSCIRKRAINVFASIRLSVFFPVGFIDI